MAKSPRLPDIPDQKLNARQRQLLEAMRAGPRGRASKDGPFGIYLHSPETGDFVQALGAHCRHNTVLPPRLSEFAILLTARQWRAPYEWHAHAAIAEQAGVRPRTIEAVRAGRVPTTAAKDERAMYDFVSELYATRRVSTPTYKRLHTVLGDTGMVDLVAVLGYYALVAMMLDVFEVTPPPDAPKYFTEPRRRRRRRRP